MAGSVAKLDLEITKTDHEISSESTKKDEMTDSNKGIIEQIDLLKKKYDDQLYQIDVLLTTVNDQIMSKDQGDILIYNINAMESSIQKLSSEIETIENEYQQNFKTAESLNNQLLENWNITLTK